MVFVETTQPYAFKRLFHIFKFILIDIQTKEVRPLTTKNLTNRGIRGYHPQSPIESLESLASKSQEKKQKS